MTPIIAPTDGWFLVPPGVPCWGRTVMHHDGDTYTNVPPPAPEPPDLRTVGDRVAELEAQLAEIMARLAAVEGYGEKAGYAATLTAHHEDRLQHVEALLHRLLNPGEQEGTE